MDSSTSAETRLQHLQHQLAVQRALTAALIRADSIEQLGAEAVRLFYSLVPAHRITFFEYDETGGTGRLVAVHEAGVSTPIPPVPAFPIARMLPGWLSGTPTTTILRAVPDDLADNPLVAGLLARGYEVACWTPLHADGHLLGALAMLAFDGAVFTPEAIQSAEDVAGHLASGLLAARERAAVERAATRLAIVHEIDAAILAAEHPGDIATRVVDRLRHLAGAERVAISTFDERRRSFRVIGLAKNGVGGDIPDGLDFPADDVAGPEVLDRHELTVYDDLQALVRQRPGARFSAEQGMRVAVMVPLVAVGRLVGLMSLGGRDRTVASGDNVMVAREVAAQLAIAIVHAQQRDAAKRSITRLAILNDVERAILAAEGTGEIVTRVAAGLRGLAGAERVTICSFDEGRCVFRVLAVDKAGPGGDLPSGIEFAAADVAGPELYERHQVSYYEDVQAAAEQLPGARHSVEQGMRVGVVVPVLAGARMIGSIAVTGRDRSVIADDNVRVVREAADQLAVAITHAEARAELERRVAQQQLVHAIDKAILASVAPPDLAARIAQPIADLARARRVAVCTTDVEAGEGRVLAFVKDGELTTPQVGWVFSLRDGLPFVGVTGRDEVVTPDLAAIADRTLVGAEQVAAGLRHAVWLPLLVDGRLLGGLGLVGDDPEMIAAPTMTLVRGIAAQIAVALQHASDRAVIAEREDRLRTILEASPNGILAVDASGRIEYANPAASRLFGPGAPLAGALVSELLPTDRAEPHLTHIETWFAQAPSSTSHPVDTLARREDGTLFPVHILLGRIDPPSGPLAIVTVIDLSDRMALEARLRQGERMEILGQFAGILAHDVRNYLTAVAWSAEMLASDLAADDPSQADVAIIAKAARDAADMTRSVLEFARPAGDLLGSTDVAAHIAGARTMLGRVLGTAVRMELDLAPDLPPAAISPTALTQVLGNLATNARDAMPEGGTLRVAASQREIQPGDPGADGGVLPAGKYVRLVVSDTGSGMDEATRLRVFDTFFTTKSPTSGSSGTGLGLSSVLLIVSRTGGAVRVDSSPGAGTTFTIDLPVAATPPGAQPASA